ncbi:S9 family peptidase [Nonomuraea sp. NPDC050328]|uniref:S9 family peptidase n=1 Tax=Nonomuraea sp. NPDC050328 TaxID=3364361 RepID=UPI00378FA50A
MRRLTLDDLYRLATPSDPRIDPAGTAVAYTLTTSDRDGDATVAEIWLAAPGAEPRRLATGSAPRWSPDGSTLAFLKPVDGTPQLHLLPMSGGEPRVLTEAKLGAGAAVWSPDGAFIAYSGPAGELDPNAPVVADRLDHKADGAGLLRGLTSQVFVVEVASGESRRLTSGAFHAGEPSWSPAGDHLVFAADIEKAADPAPGRPGTDGDLSVRGAIHRVGLDGGEPERLTGPELIATAAWYLGERLIVAGFREHPSGHTRLFELTGGETVEIETGLDRNVMTGAPGYPGATPALLGEDLLFCVRDRGYTHLVRLPAGSASAEPLEAGGQVVAGVSVAAGRVAHVAATPYSQGEVFLDGEQLTAYAPADVALFEATARRFTAPDGTEVEGFVLRDPELSGPGPLLLDIHGGPHNAWAPVFDGVHLYHQVLAAAGWTVLTLNPRASDGYGEAFYTAALGAWGLADTGDFLSPLDELVAEGVADPDRLAVTGYSYGGYMSCWLSTQTDRFRAVIPGGCVSDLTSMSGTSDAGLLLKRHELREELVKTSPLTYVSRVRTPTLILHGQNDDRCPVGQAEQWFAALREREVPVRLVRYPGGSHLFILNGRPSHRFDYNERIVQWLQQWVIDSQS